MICKIIKKNSLKDLIEKFFPFIKILFTKHGIFYYNNTSIQKEKNHFKALIILSIPCANNLGSKASGRDQTDIG